MQVVVPQRNLCLGAISSFPRWVDHWGSCELCPAKRNAGRLRNEANKSFCFQSAGIQRGSKEVRGEVRPKFANSFQRRVTALRRLPHATKRNKEGGFIESNGGKMFEHLQHIDYSSSTLHARIYLAVAGTRRDCSGHVFLGRRRT